MQVKETPLTVEVEYLKDQPYSADDDNFKATTMEVVSTIQDLVRQNPLYQEHLKHFVNSGAPYTPNPPQALPRRGRRRVHSDERVANRTIGIRVGDEPPPFRHHRRFPSPGL